MPLKTILAIAAFLVCMLAPAGAAFAEPPEPEPDRATDPEIDPESAAEAERREAIERARDQAEAMAERAIAFLRERQDEASGGWNHRESGPNLPAITGLVVNGMLLDPEINGRDPAVRRGVEYILRFSQADGGIYDRILPSYNTSICVSALAQLEPDDPNYGVAREVIDAAVRLLRGLQFSEEAQAPAGEAGVTTERVDRDHPFYGGIGYGTSGRPDNSNLTFMLQALHDAGVPGDDPAFQRALVFLARTQMLDEVNDMDYAEGSAQGGFIYATSPDGEQIGVGESKAGEIEEVTPDGRRVSRLRSYGSMTYAGFKSMVFADLTPDDPRVRAAMGWIRRNYTLRENPGIGNDGLYYYYLTFARALDTLGTPVLDIYEDEDRSRETLWPVDLIEQLAEMQEEDGSFRSVDTRWMEGDPVLITAYSLIALQHARRHLRAEAEEPQETETIEDDPDRITIPGDNARRGDR